jgi:leishmanolysin
MRRYPLHGGRIRMHLRQLSGVLASTLLIWACSDSSGPPSGGETLVIRSGNNQSALAGTPLTTPIVVALQDGAGNPIGGQTATFTVTAGGGFLSGTTGQTNPDGTITAPTWTLGKSDVPQKMQVTIGGKTAEVSASVQTLYKIDVRFFGRTLTSAQQALFTSAAARLRAMIVGKLPVVSVAGADVTDCIGQSTPLLTGTVDGMVVYASLDSIDGRSKTLAQSGPCFIRQNELGEPDYRTVIGVMKFDTADVAPLIAANALESTIVHEMLHVVGLGTFWEPKSLIITSDTVNARYIGPSGIAGCQGVGGSVTCASSVPIENCVGQSPCGAGQIFSHWRETTFRTELMTAYLNSGSDPLSAMSIRSLEDLNYTVNTAAADAYTIFIGARSSGTSAASPPLASGEWERPLPFRPKMLPTIRASTGSAK